LLLDLARERSDFGLHLAGRRGRHCCGLAVLLVARLLLLHLLLGLLGLLGLLRLPDLGLPIVGRATGGRIARGHGRHTDRQRRTLAAVETATAAVALAQHRHRLLQLLGDLLELAEEGLGHARVQAGQHAAQHVHLLFQHLDLGARGALAQRRALRLHRRLRLL